MRKREPLLARPSIRASEMNRRLAIITSKKIVNGLKRMKVAC